MLPKDTSSNYDEDSKILTAIRKQLEILKPLDSEISKDDFDNLITKKQHSPSISSIVTHDATNPTPYEITVDGEHFVLKLKQNQYTDEEEENTIINSIKSYLENEDNLNLILPKDINSNYDEDSKILIAIKTKLIDSILDFKNYDANLIVKKVGSSEVNEVATHGETSTQYEISVGEHEFTLNLNQDKFTKEEKNKIETIKTHLETSSNLNVVLPKTNYDSDDSILEAIKVKLVNDIETISSSDSHLIVKKVGSSEVTSIANHGETSTQYEISIGENEFTLNLNQDKFTKEEKNKIETIKTHLETSSNLNVVLPKTNYDSDDSILEAIKVKLVNDIETISSSDSHLIVKKVGSSEVTSIANHGEISTQYEISIGEHEFTLNLNQEEFSIEEKNKIETIRTYLETLGNLNFMLPQAIYDIDNIILESIKVKLVDEIGTISSIDSHLIVKKVDSSEVTSIATHGQAPTQYEISIGEHDFTLNLNQEEFSSNEKEKIETIKTHLETSGNLNLILPKTTYDIDNVILEAIKVKLVNDIETISSSDSHLIVKKVGSSEVTSIATHGQPSTQYEISIGGKNFILKLNKKEFSKEEKIINIIKTHLEESNNLNLMLPQAIYDIDNSILEAIKVKLVDDIGTISSIDSYLIIKKVGSSEVTSIATHGQAPTQYEISIGEHDFTLNLNQEEFTKEERTRINVIKTYLENPINLNILLPKTNKMDN
jgi:hypothetical protein